MSEKVLYKGKFVELRLKEEEGYKYEYLHEHRCGGDIVAILPVDFYRGMLVRHEFTPCWGDELNISSITGGWERDRHETPIDTVIEELREEAGIVLRSEKPIMSLGTCRGTKSSDNLYHLFLVDLSDDSMWEECEIETDGSVLEGKAHNEWVNVRLPDERGPLTEDQEWLEKGVDPLLYVMYTRWILGMVHESVDRASYK